MKKINIKGFQFTCEQRGSGTPLVLLHGFPLDGSIWDKVAPLLEDTFELFIPNLRGFGESFTLEYPNTMDDYAMDIADMLAHFGIDKAAIAGHSMGGYVALAFARLYPDRINGLGLISSQVLADTPERREGRYKSAVEVAEKGIGSIVEAMTQKFTPDEKLQALARETMERQQPAAYISALKAMAERPDSTSLLPTIDYPLVVIHGDADMLIPIARAREVKAAIPDVHLVELGNVGHMPMLEAVQETASALKHLA